MLARCPNLAFLALKVLWIMCITHTPVCTKSLGLSFLTAASSRLFTIYLFTFGPSLQMIKSSASGSLRLLSKASSSSTIFWAWAWPENSADTNLTCIVCDVLEKYLTRMSYCFLKWLVTFSSKCRVLNHSEEMTSSVRYPWQKWTQAMSY